MQELAIQAPVSTEISQAKLREMLEVIKGSRSLLILTHDNPDPDALASASCLKYIVSKMTGMRAKIGYGGMIGRAENRAMLRHLKIHTAKLTESSIKRYQSVVLIDTQPMTGNNSLPKGVKAKGVIDHHPLRKTTRAPFLDVRPDYGANSTIMTEYLVASGLDIPSNLATALFYGIGSETQDLGRETSEADTNAYIGLFPKSNKKLLSKIRHPAVEKDHFAYLSRAINNAVTYKNAIATSLGAVDNPDIVALVAEMLIALHRMSWCMCTGRYKNTILLSLRTTREKGRAGVLARKIVRPIGTAGGHDMIAGGQVDCTGKSEDERDEMERKLVANFFKFMGKPASGDFNRLLPAAPAEKQETGSRSNGGNGDKLKTKREEVK
jgi:nanoRNase/pAp phosphatase (c-di-AMP/oligoRNAs hydrolase)